MEDLSHWSAHGGTQTLSICTDEAGVPYPNPRLAERVIRVMGSKILLLTSSFEQPVGFRSEINVNLMHDVCFLTRDGRLPFIPGAYFNVPPSPGQDSTLHGGSLWLQKLEASVVTPVGSTHTCRTGRVQKPDITDYLLVSSRVRPFFFFKKKKIEVVKSVLLGLSLRSLEHIQHLF